MDMTKVIESEMIDDDEDGEPSKIMWDSENDQEKPDEENSTKMTKAAGKDMRENLVYKKDNRETEKEENARSWDKEDNEIDRGEREGKEKAAKEPIITGNGATEEDAILISDTEDEEYYEEWTR